VSPLIAPHVLSGSYTSIPDPAHALLESVETLRHVHRDRRLKQITLQIAEAQRRGDANRARELATELKHTRENKSIPHTALLAGDTERPGHNASSEQPDSFPNEFPNQLHVTHGDRDDDEYSGEW